MSERPPRPRPPPPVGICGMVGISGRIGILLYASIAELSLLSAPLMRPMTLSTPPLIAFHTPARGSPIMRAIALKPSTMRSRVSRMLSTARAKVLLMSSQRPTKKSLTPFQTVFAAAEEEFLDPFPGGLGRGRNIVPVTSEEAAGRD